MASQLSSDDLTILKNVLKGFQKDWRSSEIQRWTLSNSVFFASSIVTTIGFGHPAPSTDKGRAFCVLYVLLGIPLTFHLLSTIGRLLATYLSEIYGFIMKKCSKCGREKDDISAEDKNENKIPLWIPCLMLSSFLAASTVAMMYIENWNLRISLYYIFMALTTVGLGDVLPHNEEAVWFHILFLYVGLAAVSLTINLLLVDVKTRIYKNPFGCKFMKSIYYDKYSEHFEPDHAEMAKETDTENEGHFSEDKGVK